jgi:hypothetical protein
VLGLGTRFDLIWADRSRLARISETLVRGRYAVMASSHRAGREVRGEFVFVQQSAESVASADARLVGRRVRDRFEDRWTLLERPVWPVRVVMCDVLVQHALKVRLRNDQEPVEAFASGAADPALGVRFRLRRGDRGADHAETFGAEKSVEGFGQFDVAVADHDLRSPSLRMERCEQLARLLRRPGAVGVGGDAGDVHAPPLKLDEEEDVEAARSQMVSTVKKSHSTMPAACWRRNSRQLRRARPGTGSIPWRRRMFQTVLGESV